MKKVILFLLALFGVVVSGQAQFCENFNQNQVTGIIANGVQPGSTSVIVQNLLGNWGSRCGDLQYNNVGSQNGANDIFLHAYDRGCSDAGSWIFNSADYSGNWIQFINGGANCFCYDFRVIANNNAATNPPTSLRIFDGTTPFNSTMSATFVLNNAITVADGWQTICAPIGLADANGNPPSNAVGTWVVNGATNWDTLIQNVGGIGYYLDIGSSPSEQYGFDNICIGACVGTGCSLTSQVTNIVCNNQGTTDPSDDTWSFDLTVTNPDGTGTFWNATTPNADSGGYGNTSTIFMGNISNFSGTFNFLVADDGDPSCSTQVAVPVPDPCSDPCDLDVQVEVGECNDNGTPSDYSDDFYNVTISVTGTNGLPWMAKQKLVSDGSETVIYNGTGNVLNLQLGPFDVSDGDWTLWIGLTDYFDCVIDTFIAVPNCCNDEPYISPYWQHPNCPEVVCTADQWPIHVLSSDGTPITTAGGIIISWDNLDTPADENLIQDWIYASPLENWQATITYPNGCEYVVTYFEDCCDEDIFIKVLECPSDGQLQTYEASIKERMEASRVESKRDQTQANTQSYAQMQDELDRLQLYMEARASSSGDDCDPCELGIVFIELVDADGNVINVNSYQSFSWSDGGAGAMRSFPLPMAGPVCFTATNIEYGKECVYQDCFFYDCKEPCEAPTDLRFDCRRAGMSWTGDPSLTYIVEVGWDACCRPLNPPTGMRWEVTGTSFQLPFIRESNCFSWKVGVKCEDEIIWSEELCEFCFGRGDDGPTKPQDVATDVKTQAKVYPNPNDGNMNIEISGNDKTAFALKVYRFDGTLIKTFNENRIENQSIKISWNGKNVLSKGMYFFVITTDKETITKKVVIE